MQWSCLALNNILLIQQLEKNEKFAEVFGFFTIVVEDYWENKEADNGFGN